MAGETYRRVAQMGLETTYGTPVAASRVVYASGNPAMSRTRAARARQLATGNRMNQRAFTLGPSEVGGTVALPLSASELLEWLAITLQGAVSATMPTGATNGRLYSYTGGGETLDSMTLEFNDGARAFRGYGIYGDTMTIAGSANGEATATFALFGVERALNALTGALSSRVPTITEGYETTISIDTFGGTPGKTQIPAFLQSWSIAYGNGLQRKYLADNRNRMNRAVIAPMTLSASFTVEAANAQAATELANWDAGTKRLIGLRFGFNSINAITGDTAVNEVQTLTKGGTWSAGTYTLSVLGVTTSALAFDAVAATIQAALNTALAPLGSGYTVAVTGGPLSTTAVVVTFSGSELAGRNVPMIVADIALVTGSAPTVSVVQTTPGYEAAEGITLTIPGFWESVAIDGEDAGTTMYSLSLQHLYDPTLASAFNMTALCGRSAAWS